MSVAHVSVPSVVPVPAPPAAAAARAAPPALRFWLLLVALGALGFLGSTPFFSDMISQAVALKGMKLPAPLPLLLLAQGVKVLLFVALAAFAGVKLAPRAGLDAPFLRALAEGARPAPFGRTALWSAAFGTAAMAATLAALFAVRPFVPPALLKSAGEHHFLLGATSAFYGGIIEELLLRWGVLVSLLALLRKLGLRDAFWAANALAALLFGLGHLPAVAQMGLPLTPAVLVYVLLGNGVAGLFFGWAFRQKGLESAMVAHGTADVWLHAFLPIFLR